MNEQMIAQLSTIEEEEEILNIWKSSVSLLISNISSLIDNISVCYVEDKNKVTVKHQQRALIWLLRTKRSSRKQKYMHRRTKPPLNSRIFRKIWQLSASGGSYTYSKAVHEINEPTIIGKILLNLVQIYFQSTSKTI